MDWTLIIFITIVVAFIAFILGRWGKSEPTEKLDQIINFQAELKGHMQQSGSNIDARLDGLQKRIGDGLAQQTDKTGETLKGLHERLAVIDVAQKNISELGKEMLSLQDILSNKQLRGSFGEFQMEALIKDALPPSAYDFQATLSNGNRVDCLIRLPSPPGVIPIDSKFPLEAYRRIQQAKNEMDRKIANSNFSRDLNLHIKHITERYIIADETDWAILFLPSESIFAELNSNFTNVIERAQRKRVGIASPSTLMALVNTVGAILKDSRMKEQAGLIQQQVGIMLNDVRLLDERVEKLKNHFRQATEDIDSITTSSGKITQRGEKIKDVRLEEENQEKQLIPSDPD
jgi:DNA recombination protein RmuC